MSLPLPSFEQLQRQLKSNSDSTSSAVSSTSSSSSSSSTSSNVDPIALLKRVEDMRKWQEEQKNMLLQAHEDNLQQFRLEQERISKLLSSNQLTVPKPTISKQSDLKSNDRDDSLTEQDKNLVRLIQNQIRMKKINLDAFVDDDYDDDFNVRHMNMNKYDNEYDYEETENDVEDCTDQQQQQKQQYPDDKVDYRLSTILEVSCEESPLKGKQTNQLNNYRRSVLENNFKNKKMKPLTEIMDEENENNNNDNELAVDQIAEQTNEIPAQTADVLDIDSIPIGIKPTNKMSFEQLIEEKLKHADELDQEQLKRNVKKKPFLKRQSSASKSCKPAAVSVSTLKPTPALAPPAQPPPTQLKEPPSEPYTDSICRTVAPRKFLKRGEGLKRYQPPSAQAAAAPPPPTTTNNPARQSSSNLTSNNESNNKTIQRQTATNTNSNKLRSVSSSSLSLSNNPQPLINTNSYSANNQLNNNKMKKSQSVTNITNQAVKKSTAPSNNKQQLPQQSAKNIPTNNKAPVPPQPQAQPQSQQHATIKLKPAVQFNSTAMPSQTPLPEKQTPLIEDSELKEFETLEQYVDEHPSFRSSVSFVETVLTNNTKTKPNEANKANMFAHMLNLMKSTGFNQKLTDLLEEELNEMSSKPAEEVNSEDDLFIQQISKKLKDLENNNLEEHMDDETTSKQSDNYLYEFRDNQNENPKDIINLSSNSSTSNSSRRRTKSQSEMSTASSSRSLTRKVKKIQDFDALPQEPKRYSSEADLNAQKKKYSCIDYENEEADDDDDDEEEIGYLNRVERKISLLTSSMPLQQHPNTSSRYNSDESLDTKTTKSKNTKFNDNDTWLDSSNMKVAHQILNDKKKQDEIIQETGSVSQLMTKLFPSLKQQQLQQLQQQQLEQQQKDREIFDKLKITQLKAVQEPKTAEVNTNATLLKQKLTQLESEIERFQKKSLELSKLQEKCELELKSAESNRKMFEKQKEEEYSRLRDLHEEDVRKFKLEKKIFEQYKKSIKENPDRREREEMDRLKKQLTEQNEEFKVKESRWMANISRLKERIETLEQEKCELKKELQINEKQRIESLMMISNNNTSNNNNSVPSLLTVPISHVTSSNLLPITSNLVPSSNSNLVQSQRNNNAFSSSSSSNKANGVPLDTVDSNLYTETALNKPKSNQPLQITSKSNTSIGTNLAQHPNLNNVYSNAQIQPPNTNLMILKRSISEKSLHSSSSSTSSSSSSSSSSSTSSSCSSSSSASIGSTGSLALQSNIKYYHQQQHQQQHQYSQENSPASHPQPYVSHPQVHMQIQANESLSNNYTPTISSIQQQCIQKTIPTHQYQIHSQQVHQPQSSSTSHHHHSQQQQQQQQQQQLQHTMSQSNIKSVKFKLDYAPMPMSSAPIPAHMNSNYYDYEKENNSSNNNSHNSSSNISNSSCSMTNTAITIPTNDEYVIPMIGNHNRQLKVKESRQFDDKHVEKLLEDGTTLTMFPNGTTKEVSADKRHTFVKFFNGDRKEMNHETGTETYFYAETNITQIIYSNGMQILKFPSGQIEKHHTNKTREIIFPDKICKFIYPDGSEESRLPNGTCIKVDSAGGKIIEYPNKQREIHTKDYKRREYPDGSIKTVYTNGISETRYANGRVRIKDPAGNIISDKK